MKTFSLNAMERLYKKVKWLDQQPHSTWRCIYINLSSTDGRHNLTLREHFLEAALIELLSEHDGSMYFCEDGDIFILFQGQLKPVLKKLVGHFDGLLADQSGKQPVDELFTIFDLGKYWELFHTLCKAKYIKAIALSPEDPIDFTHYRQNVKLYAPAVQE